MRIARAELIALFNVQVGACILQLMIVSTTGAQSETSLGEREESALRAAAMSVADSVVQIRTIGGLDTASGALRADGPTSGLIISSDGFVLSSTFNFVREPASILVTFASGRQAPAELVATDHSRMLVLLKVSGVTDLPVPPIAPVEAIRVGQWAVALGRTFRTEQPNLSVGIISATNRMFGKVLQTDADASTANYGGPLVDIRGRVLGVLVPMAPQGAGEVAGAEWYDSGIGFAVPLAAIANALERMKKGEDQHAGMLGIGLSGRNPYSALARLAAVRPDAPAGLAGLQKGDRIVEVNGRAIKTQTDLRFALGPLYGGERVRVVALRGDQRIERDMELAGELKAFRHAFLGILPLREINVPRDAENDATGTADRSGNAHARARDADDAVDALAGDPAQPGIAVRAIYPLSPAENAGIQPGDRILKINDVDISGIDDAIAQLNNVAPGGNIRVRLVRGRQSRDLQLTAAQLPINVPSNLPPAYEETQLADTRTADDLVPPGTANGKSRTLKLPEFKQSCLVYEPTAISRGTPGVVIWLRPPGDDPEEVVRSWQPICDRDGLVLVVPSAADDRRWDRTELEYLRRLAERVIRQYDPDPRRVVVFGQGPGGAMAWLLGLSSRDLFRGIATSAAPLPRQVRVPENEPAARLAIVAGIASDESQAAQAARGLERLRDAGYPVSTFAVAGRTGRLTATQCEEMARWIDTLDRF